MKREPIRFIRGGRSYIIAAAYGDHEGFVGLCDGRVVASGAAPAEVARKLVIDQRDDELARIQLHVP